MASRFWVGGTGTWDAADTTHWAASSGGASGASVPSAVDDVTFDGASGAGTVTVAATANALSLTMTAFTGAMTLNAGVIVNGGNVALPTAAITLAGSFGISTRSGVAQTIRFNGSTIGGGLSAGAASTDSLTILDTSRVNGTVTHLFGTLNTNGQTCIWGLFSSSSTNTRVLTMGASAITITSTGIAWDCTTVTGLTITANTATVTMTGAGPTFRSGGKNWNGLTLIFNGFTGSAVISGNGTFAAVTFLGPPSKTATVSISTGTTTVTGLLTITGNSAINRLLTVGNGSVGSTTTWSAGTTSFANVDWRDTVGAGAAAPFTGTSMGDALGNSNIVFDAPVTRFAVAPGNWSSTATWSASSGGAPGATVPLPQDTVKLDANSPAGTYTADVPRVGKDIDFTGFTRTFTHASAITYYGVWTAAATMTWGGAGGIICEARSVVTFTTAGKTCPTGLTMNGFGGTLRLADALTGNSAIALQVTAGTLDLNGQAVSFGSFSAGGAAVVRQLAFGGATLTLTGTGTVFTGAGTNFTTSGSGLIDIVDATAALKVFAGGGFVYPTLRYRPAGGAPLTITGSNTFANLDLEASTARTINLPSGQAQFVLGTLTIAGSAGQLLSFASTTAGSQTSLWLAVGGTLVQSFVSRSVDVQLVTGQFCASQNAIDDVDRAAALLWGTAQQGGSTDGAAIPAGLGIWEGATNLFRRGQCDALGAADWIAGGASPVAAIDATVPARFSPQSVKLTSSLAGIVSMHARSATGQAIAAATNIVGSIDFLGVLGQGYNVRVRINNTDASATDGTVSNFTATGAWQSLVPAGVAVAAGKTGDSIEVLVSQTGAARVESVWLAHAMVQRGGNVVSPYIATSGGVTAARSGATLEVPMSLIGLAQGAVAMRWRMGGTPAQLASEYGASNPIRLLGIGMDAAEKFALFPTTNGNGSFTFNYQHGGVSVSVVSATGQWVNAGDEVTIVVAWTATTASISVNGGAFVTLPIAGGQTWVAKVFYLGGDQNGTVNADCTLLWASTMTNTPTTADLVRFAAIPSTPMPVAALFPSSPTAVISGIDASYFTMSELKVGTFDSVTGSALVSEGPLARAAVSDGLLESATATEA